MANWLGNNLGNLIDGNIGVDEAFIDMAEYIGQQRISGFVAGQVVANDNYSTDLNRELKFA